MNIPTCTSPLKKISLHYPSISATTTPIWKLSYILFVIYNSQFWYRNLYVSCCNVSHNGTNVKVMYLYTCYFTALSWEIVGYQDRRFYWLDTYGVEISPDPRWTKVGFHSLAVPRHPLRYEVIPAIPSPNYHSKIPPQSLAITAMHVLNR